MQRPQYTRRDGLIDCTCAPCLVCLHSLPDSLHKPIKCPEYSRTSTLVTQINARHTLCTSYLALHNYAVIFNIVIALGGLPHVSLWKCTTCCARCLVLFIRSTMVHRPIRPSAASVLGLAV